MALHRLANDFFTLLCSDQSTDHIQDTLSAEWTARWGSRPTEGWSVLPHSLEDLLPATAENKFRRVAGRVDFENSQAKLIVRFLSS